jgi:hypothetical protein
VAGQLFPFCQLDFPFRLGPADGRYLARPRDEDDGIEVMVLRTLEAERKPGKRPRRIDDAEPEPEPAPISRVTVIGAQEFADEEAAGCWLEAACRASEDDVERALRSINRALQGHRIATHDPYVTEVSRDQAHRVRIGFGAGEDLVDGRHTKAYLVPPPRPRRGRRAMLEPQGELAGILAGRRPPMPSEDLLLRARLDLAEGRVRQAAIQAGAAASALAAEMNGEELLPAEVSEWMQARLPVVRGLADTALSQEPPAEAASDLDDALTGMERIARRRRLAAAASG